MYLHHSFQTRLVYWAIAGVCEVPFITHQFFFPGNTSVLATANSVHRRPLRVFNVPRASTVHVIKPTTNERTSLFAFILPLQGDGFRREFKLLFALRVLLMQFRIFAVCDGRQLPAGRRYAFVW